MLQTTQLIGFGAGVSGGLSALTNITASMWDGVTAGWSTSGNSALRNTGSSGSKGIRIFNSAPVLDADFVFQWRQLGDGNSSTSSAWGMYDIAEDSTFNSGEYRMGQASMTNSFWLLCTAANQFETYKGNTDLTANISFSVNDIFKYQRTGTSLKLFVAGVEKQEWTGVTQSLRFCITGFQDDGSNSIDQIQFQN
jgi:hypothetical protein